MKRYRSVSSRGVLLATLLLAACGGKESVASRSAAAYREAQAKGTPVAGGHDHGGHTAGPAMATNVPVDHSAHDMSTATGANPHAGHDMTAATATMDHGAHGATASADHSAMGHGTSSTGHAGHGAATQTGHAQHRTTGTSNAHAGHAATPTASAHETHAGMQHGSSAAADPHAQHATSPAARVPTIATVPPRSSGDMRNLQPSSTLQPDAFDAPAPASVSEAARASAAPATDHSQHGAAVYVCPMHPEVTSDQPGKCPKCGMTLVKKNR